MYEICCECEWIPGRTGFPPHVHRTRTKFRTTDERRLEIETYSHVIPQRALEIIEQEEVVLISVNWKEVARGLHRRVEALPG